MTDKITELIDKIKAARSTTELRALRAELRRARGGRNRGQDFPGGSRPQRPRGQTSAEVSAGPDLTVDPGQDPHHRPAVIGNDDVSGWPPELRRRARGGRFW
ncbi:hypothetical protein [Streptomyces sp. NPDC051554]|uniref:hypothetical protein n=1 Tax=Streptomyces sp. NPDC051554 TaxID=3365656 RepID=UPI0037BC8B91